MSSVTASNPFAYASQSKLLDILSPFAYNESNKTKSEVGFMFASNLTPRKDTTYIPNSETIAAIEETDRLVDLFKRGEKPGDLYVFDSKDVFFESLGL